MRDYPKDRAVLNDILAGGEPELLGIMDEFGPKDRMEREERLANIGRRPEFLKETLEHPFSQALFASEGGRPRTAAQYLRELETHQNATVAATARGLRAVLSEYES